MSCVSIVYDHGGFVSAEEIAAGRGPSLIAGVLFVLLCKCDFVRIDRTSWSLRRRLQLDEDLH